LSDGTPGISMTYKPFAIVGVSFSLLPTNEAFAFTFTKIAETNNDTFSSFGIWPAINNQGNVVFSAELSSRGSGIFVGNGGTTTTIADTSGILSLFSSRPGINNAGVVAFGANLKTIGSGIFTVDSKGTLTTIAESTQPRGVFGDPVINNGGTVAFSSTINGDQAIFISSNGTLRTIADTTNNPYSFFDGYAINDGGSVAISARQVNGNGGILISDGQNTTTAVDTSDRFSFLFPPVINNSGIVAFKGVVKALAGEGIFTVSDGKMTTIAENIGQFNFFENPAINNSGTVAFKGVLKVGGLGIFTGSNPLTDKVIAAGDPLFGSTVTDLFLSNQGLNDANQVAFYAKLADGTTGIFRADPEPNNVPEANSMLGVMVAAALGTILRLKRHQEFIQKPKLK
jgi:hypothetical protein